jgi:hypothetical protein
MDDDFTIVFEKLNELSAQGHLTPLVSEATVAEIEEIAELRNAVLEITQPPPASYTTA